MRGGLTYTVRADGDLYIFLGYLDVFHVLDVVARQLEDVGRDVLQHRDQEQTHGAVDFVLQHLLQEKRGR